MTSIGIDAGTSVVKAVRFSVDGEVEDSASVTTAVHRPHPGWVEQDMAEVWAAVAEVVRRVAPADGVVDVVAVTAQGDGCWLVDGAGRPVRPAMLWSDARAASVVDEWEAAGLLDEVFAVTGSYGNSGLPNAELAWLAQHEPDAVQRASSLLSCGSWVFSCLTGQRALHVSDACNPLVDAATGDYALPLLDRLGLGWAAGLLPPLVSGPDAAAELGPDAAAAVGLRAGTPVVLGPYDVVASALGVGAVATGGGFGILGTTLCVGAVATDPALSRTPSGMSLATGWPGRWLLTYATLAGTEVIEWTRRLLKLPTAASVVELAMSSVTERPPLVLPYLSPAGERAPFRDSRTRGAMLGLTLEHTDADVARGVLVGLSLTVRDCLTASGQRLTDLAVCGGGARSGPWCQMLADATGLTVTRADQEEVGARGAVLSGLVATHRYPDVEAAAATVSPGEVFVPDPAQSGFYTESYARALDAREVGVTRA